MPTPVGGSVRTRERALSVPEVAWMLLLPFAAATLIAIIFLGPPLGRVLFPPGSDPLWPPDWWEAQGRAEPVKHGRYVLAVLAPLLFAGAIAVASRRRLALRPSWVRPVVLASYAAVLALVGATLIRQHVIDKPGASPREFVGLGAIAVAATLVVIALALMRTGRAASWVAVLSTQTTTRRRVVLAVVVVFLTSWLLAAVQTDRTVGDFGGPLLPWTLNDALAVLDGRTPLADYHVLYAKLMPYPVAGVLAVFGTTTFVYTTFMAVLTGLVLLAVYGVFRLVTPSSLLALALLVPFVATSDVPPGTPIRWAAFDNLRVGSPMMMSAVWAMRYGGVYLLAWLTARHIAGQRPHRPATIFFIGALVAINSLEFGVAPVLASVAALLCARPPRSFRAASRLALELVGGAAAAIALVALGTLARAGEPPELSQLLEWPHVFTNLGLLSMPLSTWGLHLAMYLTFAAALATAVVRSSQRVDGRTLTGMLAWSGVSGLFLGGYYVGRPDVYKLTTLLSAWSFALTMLTVACVLELSARGWRRPTLPQLLVLFGFGLSLCSLSRVTLPQEPIAQLTKQYPEPQYEITAEQLVRKYTEPGETVVILAPMSYRISHAVGVRNVAPYGYMNAIVTRSAMRTLITTLRREHVRTVFTPTSGVRLLGEGDSADEQLQTLVEIGFQPIDTTTDIVVFRKV